MTKIPSADVKWHSLSSADPNARLFRWDGGLYRAVRVHRANQYVRMFENCTIGELIDRKLLVESELTDLSLEGFDLVIKHRELPFVSYPHEWPAAMLKKAALNVLELESLLRDRGLGLQDCHPWNLVFDGTQPLFVDLGSIIDKPVSELWEANGEFFRYYVYPLQILATPYARVARWLLRDYQRGISPAEADCLAHPFRAVTRNKGRSLRRWLKNRIPKALHRPIRTNLQFLDQIASGRKTRPLETRQDHLQRLKTLVEKLPQPSGESAWLGYYENEFPDFSAEEGWKDKHKSVYRVLKECEPRTVFDIAANRGWYSMLAARLGARVVACDLDEQCMNALAVEAARQQLCVQPVILDVRDPSPGAGIRNRELASASDRLKCDLVMALALVHHMAFSLRLGFDQIVAALSEFSAGDLLVEFIPKEDRYVQQWWSPEYSWYTLENFQKALRQSYRSIAILPSHPEPRVLLLCRR